MHYSYDTYMFLQTRGQIYSVESGGTDRLKQSSHVKLSITKMLEL